MTVNSIGEFIAHTGEQLLFFNVLPSDKYHLPFLCAWLIIAALFFSIKLRFVNLNLIWRAFQYFFSKSFLMKQQNMLAKNTTKREASRSIVLFNIGSSVDIGSISGVAIAVAMVGPGVIFWIFISGIASASIRFAEVVLTNTYRKNGINGGPHVYIREAFSRLGLNQYGRLFANLFSFALVISTFCSLQLNQAIESTLYFVPSIESHRLILCFAYASIIMTMLLVGFKRISLISNTIVPLMSNMYLLITAVVMIYHHQHIMHAISVIISDAFSPPSGIAGIILSISTGAQRAFFCNETGMGTGAIAHSRSINEDPASEGIISMITPIVSASMICICSGMIVVISNAYQMQYSGFHMIIAALQSVHSKLPIVMALIVPLFGLSTAIAWGYYGQTIWSHLFGIRTVFIYNIALFCSYIGSGMVENFNTILSIADFFNLSITLPNVVALYLLSGVASSKLSKYKIDYKKNINIKN